MTGAGANPAGAEPAAGGRRLFIATYGCQMNVYDSGRLGELMRLGGWTMAGSPEEADFVFVNTCSIREKAARRVVSHLKRLRSAKLANPALILGVGGCVAEQEGRALIDEVPWLNLVAGPGRLEEIPAVLETLTAASPPVVLAGYPGQEDAGKADAGPGEAGGAEPPSGKPVIPMAPRPAEASAGPSSVVPSSAGPASAGPSSSLDEPAPVSSFLTIMRGCDNWCAYCVVPYLRGRETSRPLDEIVSEARSLIRRGSREITLLGQNVNSYGLGGGGFRGAGGFVELLGRIGRLPGLERLRFTTSHPKDFPPDLIGLFGSLPVLCEHLHLPIQAGSDRILAAMGRRYDLDRYLRLVESLRRAQPDLALSTDVIVGFPGETEEDFRRTLEALETVRFDSIYSFKYSDRPMTAANRLGGKVPEEEKARRLDLVQSLQRSITLAKHRSMEGRLAEVLVEGPGRKPGQMTGRSRDFKPVNFDGPPDLLGRLVPVEIVEGRQASLLGRQTGPPR